MSCSQCNTKRAKVKCRSCDTLLCSVSCFDVHIKQVGCTMHMKTAYERGITNTKPKLATELREEDMSMFFLYLAPGESLGEESHPDATQFFMVLSGSGEATIGGKADIISLNSMFYVPKNTLHNVKASISESLRMLTIYSKKDHETEKF